MRRQSFSETYSADFWTKGPKETFNTPARHKALEQWINLLCPDEFPRHNDPSYVIFFFFSLEEQLVFPVSS